MPAFIVTRHQLTSRGGPCALGDSIGALRPHLMRLQRLSYIKLATLRIKIVEQRLQLMIC